MASNPTVQPTPTFFSKPSAFRKWLEKNAAKKQELLVGFYKISTAKPSMTWSESVDEAICFGWIDGIRKSFNEEAYTIRFTPRKTNSIWSNVNIKKAEELIKTKRMQPAGLAIFNLRKTEKSGIYAFEVGEVQLPAQFEKLLKANKKAWAYFQKLAPSYKKTSIHWVISAKQETTQIKRMQSLIADCAAETNQWKDNKYTKK